MDGLRYAPQRKNTLHLIPSIRSLLSAERKDIRGVAIPVRDGASAGTLRGGPSCNAQEFRLLLRGEGKGALPRIVSAIFCLGCFLLITFRMWR